MLKPNDMQAIKISSFSHRDEDDNYLYHVTTVSNAKSILENGFTNNNPMFRSDPYPKYSKGKAFFTERSGVKFWIYKVKEQLEYNYHNPSRIAVIRIPKMEMCVYDLRYDKLGSHDAESHAWYTIIL